MIKQFIWLEWKAFTRSASFSTNLALKILMVFGALYFIFIFAGLGIGLYFILDEAGMKPFDVVNIRRMAVTEKPEMVIVKGSVAYPGKYVLVNKKEKIYDVIQRAGGLTSTASLNGIKIKRPKQRDKE